MTCRLCRLQDARHRCGDAESMQSAVIRGKGPNDWRCAVGIRSMLGRARAEEVAKLILAKKSRRYKGIAKLTAAGAWRPVSRSCRDDARAQFVSPPSLPSRDHQSC